MAWLNVDIPTTDCCIHDDPNCSDVRRWSGGTTLKGSGTILVDGGWLQFPTVAAAQAHAAANYPSYTTHQHCRASGN